MGQSLLHIFELGKIEALYTIRKDVFLWLSGIIVVLSLLGYFGISELISNTVKNEVESELENMKELIGNVTWAAQQKIVTAKEKVDLLNKSVDELTEKKSELENSLVMLREKRDELQKIIENENLSKIFAKIASDFYTIKVFSIDTKFEFDLDKEQFIDEISDLLGNFVWLSTKIENLEPNYIVQTHNEKHPTFIRNEKERSYTVVFQHVLFAPYRTTTQPLCTKVHRLPPGLKVLNHSRIMFPVSILDG
ncbi:hypothetical protein [Candidatus Thiosymbion oneisti]|uniref:hypothetical protein n=1 Tax=Candidatus Thiosymbion oneisti TaxID=589554 RepID=UPI00105EB9AC|nr:hypothetical protein [Candidatus Thiosymbion oneisti]